jgi:hypothetical protein
MNILEFQIARVQQIVDDFNYREKEQICYHKAGKEVLKSVIRELENINEMNKLIGVDYYAKRQSTST